MPITNQQQKLFYGLPFHQWLIYRLTWKMVWFINFIVFRIKFTGLKKPPKDNTYLLELFWPTHPFFQTSRFLKNRKTQIRVLQ
jgi:hypothetical protein